MSMLFRNWLEEGFYEEDGMGELTRIEDPIEIYRAHRNGSLYHNDGYTTSKVSDEESFILPEKPSTKYED